MKARVHVSLKNGVLDPQGKAINHALHGLGFAGALKQFGQPDNHLAVALLSFNVGVELGQLLVVAAAWLLVRALAPWPGVARLRTAVP